jgi:hypothetical protein
MKREKEKDDRESYPNTCSVYFPPHTGLSVRVFRGFKSVTSSGTNLFIYEGLFNVIEHKTEPSKDG